ncbi:hypothetical protein KHQ81_07640 [Mycoplasmatota bacterium]|nr:hypothetical protein KHQ81_07640 [Mycoplasmatota bacterium]
MKRRILHKTKDPNNYLLLLIICDIIGLIITVLFVMSFISGNNSANLYIGAIFLFALLGCLFMTYIVFEASNSLWVKGTVLYLRRNEWKVDSICLKDVKDFTIQGFYRNLFVRYTISGITKEYQSEFGSVKEELVNELNRLIEDAIK